jgi:hypothetical protein
MRQSIKILSWTITISALLLALFLITVFYSASLLLNNESVRVGEFQQKIFEEDLILSMPITLNNTGYYDITNFHISTTLKDSEDIVLTQDNLTISQILKGQAESITHNITVSLKDVQSLLYEDILFKIETSVSFRYAYSLGFNIRMINMSIPWGAPLYNLQLEEANIVSLNESQIMIEITLNVENHYPLDINGVLNYKVYNETGASVGSGTEPIVISSGESLTEPFISTIDVSDFQAFTGKGFVEVSLEIPSITSIDLGRVYYE